MPKSRVRKSRMFREFSPLQERHLSHTGMELLGPVYRFCKKTYGLSQSEIHCLLLGYSYEFFTIDHMSSKMGLSRYQFQRRTIAPLGKAGYLYRHFERLSGNKIEEFMFRDEESFCVRFALTQKGRLFVAKFYRMCSGKEPMSEKPSL